MNTEIRSLTGLRGIAAFYVMIFHYDYLGKEAGFLQGFLDHGYLAVDLFFVLSGFVMALTYGHLFQGQFSLQNYRKFMERRFARVYPLYFFVTILAILHDHIFFPPYYLETPSLNAGNIATHLFLIQAWGFSTSYMGQTWSISTEVFAYALFPLLTFFTLFRGRVVAVLSAAISFIVIVALYLNWFSYPVPTAGALDFADGGNFGPLMRCVAEFTLGLLAYRVSKNIKVANFIQKKISEILLTLIIVVLLFIPDADVLIVPLLPLFIVALASDKGIVARFLGWKPIYGLGVISYSLYLVHAIPQWFREDGQAFLEQSGVPHAYTVSMMIMVIATMIFSVATYFIIEKPGRILLQRMISRQKPILIKAD